MGTGRSISADFDDVRAGRDVRIGDTHNYYSAADRPPGLHVGVPPMPAHFVGREELVADVARRLIAGSTLALSADGLPGVGKTTLAVALAYRREVLDHFTDGVLWGALGLQPNVMEVLASWAAALGIDVSQATDPATRAALVRNAIGQRRFLLVIDDAWPPEDNALLLRCGGPNCAHFLTTRNESIARAFADPQGKVDIRELDPDDALTLLVTLAPEACAAEPDAARGLVAAVGYLPLAIELMGAYLSAAENRYFREQQTAALQRMADPAERLRQVCKRLGDVQGTQVTLKETIRLSLEGLPSEAVDAFQALGAFAPKPETFDAKAAVAVTGASLATLSRLSERHLLEQEGEALSLHQTVADAAREHTAADAVERHALYYLEGVREADEDWREVEVLYAQVKWAFDRLEDASSVLDFTSTLRTYQSLRGFRDDALRWSDREITAVRELGDLRREAEALLFRGWLHNEISEGDQALECYEQALPIQREFGIREGEAATLLNIGSVYKNRGEYNRALEYYEEALRIVREVGNRWGEAVTLNSIGVAHYSLGERDRALEYFQQALPIRREVGDRSGEASTLGNIGSVYDSLGERYWALEYHEQALLIEREVGDRRREAATLNRIGAVYAGIGERDRALAHFQQALPIQRAVRDRRLEATTLNNIGHVYYSLSDHDRALEYYGQALPIIRAVGARDLEAVTLTNIGLVYDSLGDRDRALDYYEQALPIQRATGDREGEAITRFVIAMVHRASGRLDQAVAELRQVVKLDAAVKRPELGSDRRVLAEVETELAKRAQDRRFWRRLLSNRRPRRSE